MKILFVSLLLFLLSFNSRSGKMDHFKQVLLKTLGGPVIIFSCFPWEVQEMVMISFSRTCPYLAFHFLQCKTAAIISTHQIKMQKINVGSLQYPGKTQNNWYTKRMQSLEIRGRCVSINFNVLLTYLLTVQCKALA